MLFLVASVYFLFSYFYYLFFSDFTTQGALAPVPPPPLDTFLIATVTAIGELITLFTLSLVDNTEKLNQKCLETLNGGTVVENEK